MSVNFTALFERGKYASNRRLPMLSASDDKQRMEQHERFAVAMIGLVLDHDEKFRAHFLDRLCGLGNQPDPSGWEVYVEPHNWGDLVLIHRTSLRLVVVEFKIDSPLKDHQNPENPEFSQPADRNTENIAGYGLDIPGFAKREGLTNHRYVTVQKEASWRRVNQTTALACNAKEWKELLRPDVSRESGLEACLYDSLSRLGVYSFVGRNMNRKKLAAAATEPLALLIGVLQALGVDKFNPKNVNASAEWLGVDITRKDLRGLNDLVQPEGNMVGWFGYEAESTGPRLSVWLYSTASTVRQVEKRLNAAKRLPGVGGEVKRDVGNPYVFISLAGTESNDDKEWFQSVLRACAAEA
jgi:hypothetical protein